MLKKNNILSCRHSPKKVSFHGEQCVRRKHGGNIYQAARQLGVRADKIIDFSANINPLGFSPRVKKIFSSISSAILNYPDQDAGDFINALAEYHGLPAENFIAGNGSTEFIYMLPDIIRPKSVLIVTPAFTEYENSYQRAQGIVFYSPTQEKQHFAVQEKQLCDELQRGYSAVYICNPANPTGALTQPDTIKKIISIARAKGTSIILDETFMDFTEEYSLKKQVRTFDNLFILRSMTKFFALPGLRIGYIISHRKNIDKIRGHQEPWSVNAVAQRAAVASLRDSVYIKKTRAYLSAARQELVRELKKIHCLTVFNSFSNFLLLKLNAPSSVPVITVYEILKKKGLLIRTCDDFHGLGKAFFRIAIKKRNENKKLVNELKIILGSA
jgi:threonine-phosphate decarboxylase